MQLSEAIRKSIKAYYDGTDMPELTKASKRKYDKKYLDDFEKNILGDDAVEPEEDDE